MGPAIGLENSVHTVVAPVTVPRHERCRFNPFVGQWCIILPLRTVDTRTTIGYSYFDGHADVDWTILQFPYEHIAPVTLVLPSNNASFDRISIPRWKSTAVFVLIIVIC